MGETLVFKCCLKELRFRLPENSWGNGKSIDEKIYLTHLYYKEVSRSKVSSKKWEMQENGPNVKLKDFYNKSPLSVSHRRRISVTVNKLFYITYKFTATLALTLQIFSATWIFLTQRLIYKYAQNVM